MFEQRRAAPWLRLPERPVAERAGVGRLEGFEEAPARLGAGGSRASTLVKNWWIRFGMMQISRRRGRAWSSLGLHARLSAAIATLTILRRQKLTPCVLKGTCSAEGGSASCA